MVTGFKEKIQNNSMILMVSKLDIPLILKKKNLNKIGTSIFQPKS